MTTPPPAAAPAPRPLIPLGLDDAVALLEAPTATVAAPGPKPSRTLDVGQRAVVAALTAAPASDAVRGVYLHGGVGRGKTWITDTLARAVAPREHHLDAPVSGGDGDVRLRLHLHALLGAVNRLSVRHAGSLADAVRAAVAGVDLLVLDEFVVHDVADGILLTLVLEALLAPRPAGAGGSTESASGDDVAPGPRVLVTSNVAPEDLLDDPMHHHRMGPAIALIRRHLDVVRLADGEDYRGRAADDAVPASQRHGFASGTWRRTDPTTQTSGPGRARTSGRRAPGADPGSGVVVEVSGRRTPVTAADEDARSLTATFAQLCAAPLSVQDHLTLACRFDTWRLTDVPAPADIDPQALQRLAHLVDVLVDRDAVLHVAAAMDLEWFARGVRASTLRDPDRFLSRLSLLRTI